MRDFRGKRVAIDGYSWLHKGAYCCSTDLCMGRPTDKYVTYFMSRVDVLTSSGLTPVVVFDGGPLPMKRAENQSRRKTKKQNFEKGRALLEQGKTQAADEHFQRAVNITPDHAKDVIDALQRRRIEYIVAPYEADSQMAFLARKGIVDLVVTEDSDLLAYGCEDVLFKLDKAGFVQQVSLRQVLRAPAFAGFTQAMFTEMCVLAGCDFLSSVPKIGIKRAFDYVKKLRGHKAVIKRLKYSGFKVPETYESDFRRALMVFHHQTVFDPTAKTLRHLTPIPGSEMAAMAEAGDGEDLSFLGPHHSDEIARGVAEGRTHPTTMEPFKSRGTQASSSQPKAQPLRRSPRKRKPSGFQPLGLGQDDCTTRKISSIFSAVPGAHHRAMRSYVKPRTRTPDPQSQESREGASPQGIARIFARHAMGEGSRGKGVSVLPMDAINRIKKERAAKKKAVTSKYFQSSGAKAREEEKGAAEGDREGNPTPSTSTSTLANSGNYLKRCTSEAQRIGKAIKEDLRTSPALADASNRGVGGGGNGQEMVSPPRKMHKMMRSDIVCSKPFQPPAASTKRRAPNIFSRKKGQSDKPVVGLKFQQYRLRSD